MSVTNAYPSSCMIPDTDVAGPSQVHPTAVSRLLGLTHKNMHNNGVRAAKQRLHL